MKRRGWALFFLLTVLGLAALRVIPILRARQPSGQLAAAPSLPDHAVKPSIPVTAGQLSPGLARSSPMSIEAAAPPFSKSDPSRRTRLLLTEARESLRQGSYSTAASLIQEALQVDPSSREARSFQKEMEEAIRLSKKKEREEKIASYQSEAKDALKGGQAEEARKFLRAAEELDPANRETFRLFQETYRADFNGQERSRQQQFEVRLKAALGGPADELSVAESVEASAAQEGAGSTVQPEEVLHITVFEEPDLTTRARVSRAGEITFPMLGRVQVAGLTVEGVQEKLTKLLSEDFLVHPQIQVFIDTPRTVSVTGKVMKPGSYPISTERSMTVMEVITLAGGFTNDADLNGTRIIRTVGRQKQTIRVRVTDIIQGGDKSKDATVRAGDIIFVPESFF